LSCTGKMCPLITGQARFYIAFFVGTVNWTKRAGGEKVAFVILMKYDGRLAYHIPAHILEEDAGAVFDALERMRVWRASSS